MSDPVEELLNLLEWPGEAIARRGLRIIELEARIAELEALAEEQSSTIVELTRIVCSVRCEQLTGGTTH